ncbi:DUF4878 domain-containing protein [Alistipes sp. OttesenSCG-928-L06]|nr:DUF4878 domain-containing protein [Alistipes sp. OttesenSCG-928-L06]
MKNIQFRLLDSHAHDDDSAHVTLEVTNPEGEKNEATFDMKKIDGVWKIVVPM